jgi:hypothetical protein
MESKSTTAPTVEVQVFALTSDAKSFAESANLDLKQELTRR